MHFVWKKISVPRFVFTYSTPYRSLMDRSSAPQPWQRTLQTGRFLRVGSPAARTLAAMSIITYPSSRIIWILAFKLCITHSCTFSFRDRAAITSSSRVPAQTRWWMMTFSVCPCRWSRLFAWV